MSVHTKRVRAARPWNLIESMARKSIRRYLIAELAFLAQDIKLAMKVGVWDLLYIKPFISKRENKNYTDIFLENIDSKI